LKRKPVILHMLKDLGAEHQIRNPVFERQRVCGRYDRLHVIQPSATDSLTGDPRVSPTDVDSNHTRSIGRKQINRIRTASAADIHSQRIGRRLGDHCF
jgi:hypothetical protein